MSKSKPLKAYMVVYQDHKGIEGYALVPSDIGKAAMDIIANNIANIDEKLWEILPELKAYDGYGPVFRKATEAVKFAQKHNMTVVDEIEVSYY